MGNPIHLQKRNQNILKLILKNWLKNQRFSSAGNEDMKYKMKIYKNKFKNLKNQICVVKMTVLN